MDFLATKKNMSNITGDEGSFSSAEEAQGKQVQNLKNHFHGGNSSNATTSLPPPPKKKRNLPGTPGFIYIIISVLIDIWC